MLSKKYLVKQILIIYILGVVLVSVMPFGGTSASLNSIDVLSLRLDYLLHALVFLPLLPAWRLAFPNHHWVVIIPSAILLAITAEASHYLLPYRAYNIYDLISNVAGAMLGAIPAMIIHLLQKRKKRI